MVTLEQNYNRVRFFRTNDITENEEKGKNLLNTIEIA